MRTAHMFLSCLAVLTGCTETYVKEDLAAPLDLLEAGDLSAWQHRNGSQAAWRILADGGMEVVPGTGDLMTRQDFGDHIVELEFRVPLEPGKTGQARGNSGVYVQGRYEVQILDSFAEAPAMDNCGAIYGVAPALASAARPPETWQKYRIQFLAPRFAADGTMTSPPRMTVLQNGVLIHNDVELPGPTRAGLDDVIVKRGPLLLQDHGSPLQFRNIRIWE